jgi:hypothetical protein
MHTVGGKMNSANDVPQTITSVIGALITGPVVFVGGRTVIGFLTTPPWTVRAGIGMGLASGLMSVAFAYRQRPPHSRLTPAAAIIVGVLGIVLMIGTIMLVLPVDAPWGWRLAALTVFLAAPVFLLASGIRGRSSDTSHGIISGGGI